LKIFVDSADVEQIEKAMAMGCVDGVTTNPTLMSKQDLPFEEAVKKICELVDGPVSVEVTALDAEGMVKEGEKYAGMSKNVVIKIPMTEEGLVAIKQLTAKGIKTNCTLVFSANQALLAAKAGATYVSPFVGRLDDIGQNGMKLVEEIVLIYKNYGFKTEVIVASIRHPMHIVEAAIAGAHVATIPPETIEKMAKHPLTDAGIKKFLADWEKVKK